MKNGKFFFLISKRLFKRSNLFLLKNKKNKKNKIAMPPTVYFYPSEQNPSAPTPVNSPTKKHRPRETKETPSPSCFIRGLHFLFNWHRPDVTNVSQAHANYQSLADVFNSKDD